MPTGPGTYGSKKGRPPEKDKQDKKDKPRSFQKLKKKEQDTSSEASKMFLKKKKGK